MAMGPKSVNKITRQMLCHEAGYCNLKKEFYRVVFGAPLPGRECAE